MNKVWYLKRINLFRDFSNEELEKISASLMEERYSKGQIVTPTIDQDSIYLVKEGDVQIKMSSESGKETIVCNLVPGHICGVFNAKSTNRFYFYAKEKSQICVIKKEDLLNLLAKRPKALRRFLKELFKMIEEKEEQITILSESNPEEKVKSLFYFLARKFGIEREDNLVIRNRLTHRDIAEMSGLTRETVTRTITSFKDNGLLSQTKEGFWVLNSPVLENN
jgi:CRP/FNR family transcriptional regulator